MEIKKELIQKLSRLAAVSLSDEEMTRISKYLQETLSHFQKIKEIDTKGVPALSSPFHPSLKLREDKVVEFSSKEELLELAPDRQGQLFKVPPVV